MEKAESPDGSRRADLLREQGTAPSLPWPVLCLEDETRFFGFLSSWGRVSAGPRRGATPGDLEIVTGITYVEITYVDKAFPGSACVVRTEPTEGNSLSLPRRVARIAEQVDDRPSSIVNPYDGASPVSTPSEGALLRVDGKDTPAESYSDGDWIGFRAIIRERDDLEDLLATVALRKWQSAVSLRTVRDLTFYADQRVAWLAEALAE